MIGGSRPVRLLEAFVPRGNYAPQHFLCFSPLPQGQGSFRPTFTGFLTGVGRLRSISTSAMFSGSSGSTPTTTFQPFLLQMERISSALRTICIRTTAGWFELPSFFATLNHLKFILPCRGATRRACLHFTGHAQGGDLSPANLAVESPRFPRSQQRSAGQRGPMVEFHRYQVGRDRVFESPLR